MAESTLLARQSHLCMFATRGILSINKKHNLISYMEITKIAFIKKIHFMTQISTQKCGERFSWSKHLLPLFTQPKQSTPQNQGQQKPTKLHINIATKLLKFISSLSQNFCTSWFWQLFRRSKKQIFKKWRSFQY